MRRYLVDSSILAAYLHGRSTVVSLLTPFIEASELATSILVYAEVVEYLMGLKNFKNKRTQLRKLLGAIYPYFVTYSILDKYAEVRRELRPPRGKGLIGDIDTLIAATALQRKLTIITTDKDFLRVPKLEAIFVDPKSLRR